MKNKKGVSAVVSSVILIVIVIAALTIVWTIVNKTIKDETKKAKSCFDIQDKIYLDNQYTCYNFTSNELQFYLGIKDIDVENVLVSVKGSSASKSFEIPKKVGSVKMYNKNDEVVLPGKNGGLLYVVSDLDIGKINAIEIAPVIDGEQCEVIDSITQIDNCLSMA